MIKIDKFGVITREKGDYVIFANPCFEATGIFLIALQRLDNLTMIDGTSVRKVLSDESISIIFWAFVAQEQNPV